MTTAKDVHDQPARLPYFHLDDVPVGKGQIIGTVGATGRVTRPHLYWRVRINNAKVIPLELIDLSREMDQQNP
ncbi:MAG: hypothetical protein CVU54_04340 [Deltaproteobacteria bacterium HGW-Deltaproteobacteria-12]|nr:MAG: hypothetical protein CVU54_04340 [Deltaproteobacteria bacterium HGW-Deltaproteobacteria-12]